MKTKLYSNMKRMTTGFGVGILCATLSVLGLRFTVFSDMAAAPEKTASSLVTNTDVGYQINNTVYFSDASAKGDVFIANLTDDYRISVDITLDGESILSSGLLNPGMTYNSTRMNPQGQMLPDGVYKCVAEITIREYDMKTVAGTAREEVEFYIGVKPEKS